MLYEYINDETGETIDEDFPMAGDIPKTIVRKGKKYRRNWSKKFAGVIVPDSFRTDDMYAYDKSPSGKKHYY